MGGKITIEMERVAVENEKAEAERIAIEKACNSVMMSVGGVRRSIEPCTEDTTAGKNISNDSIMDPLPIHASFNLNESKKLEENAGDRLNSSLSSKEKKKS